MPYRNLFRAMSLVFALCGVAQAGKMLAYAQDLPSWLLAGMQVFVPAALIALSIFMFVLESQSAHDAVELARSHSGPIHVLLTDVVMPGLRGTELALQVVEYRPSYPRDLHFRLRAKLVGSPNPSRRSVPAKAFSFCVPGRTA